MSAYAYFLPLEHVPDIICSLRVCARLVLQSAWTPSAFRSGQAVSPNSSTGVASGGTVASMPEPGKVGKPEFPKGRGQALGGHGAAADPEDARRARLAALERRRGDSNV
jgi:hypothetical protein